MRVPELAIRMVTPLAGPGDPSLATAAATRVRELLAGGVVVENGSTDRPLGPRDVAVITPHVEQASAVVCGPRRQVCGSRRLVTDSG